MPPPHSGHFPPPGLPFASRPPGGALCRPPASARAASATSWRHFRRRQLPLPSASLPAAAVAAVAAEPGKRARVGAASGKSGRRTSEGAAWARGCASAPSGARRDPRLPVSEPPPVPVSPKRARGPGNHSLQPRGLSVQPNRGAPLVSGSFLCSGLRPFPLVVPRCWVRGLQGTLRFPQRFLCF